MIARSSSIALAPPTRRTAKPLTILVVDRERSQLARTAEMLRAAHPALEIQMAANGREVFEALTSSQADLIAIDLELPDLDAIGLLSEICSFKRVPRVIVCADASAEQRAELRRSGALSTLVYPYDAADLIALIPSVLASPAGLTVAGFGSLLALTKKSRQLHLALGRESADLTFEDGVLVDAEWGALTGDAAAIEIFRWEHPRIECRTRRNTTSGHQAPRGDFGRSRSPRIRGP
jgi:DNA-binding response OmpR family regulator